MVIIIIHKGEPTAEVLKVIGEMIQEGYHSGIDQPSGVNWEYRRSREK